MKAKDEVRKEITEAVADSIEEAHNLGFIAGSNAAHFLKSRTRGVYYTSYGIIDENLAEEVAKLKWRLDNMKGGK